MGLIDRQATKRTLVNYAGVLIGGIGMLSVYSNYKEFYGLYQFLISLGTVIGSFVFVGATNIPVRFFPEWNSAKGDAPGLFKFTVHYSLFFGILMSCLLLSVFFIFSEYLAPSGTDELFERYWMWSILVGFLLGARRILSYYVSVFKRVVVPAIVSNLWSKIVALLLVLLVGLGVLSTDQFVLFIIVSLALSSVMLLIYLRHLGRLDWSGYSWYVGRTKFKEILTYSAYGFLASVGAELVLKLDSIMISRLIDLKSNGVYSILVFIVCISEIPLLSIHAILNPFISESMAARDYQRVNSLYKSYSSLLLVVGLMIFGCILLSIEDFVHFLPKSSEFTHVFGITLFIGLSKMVNMATSVNTQIILHSEYYRFNLYITLVLGFLNILLNYFFISSYGILGAAMATFSAMLLYNGAKVAYLYYRYTMLPFSWRSVVIISLALMIYFVVTLIPGTGEPLINIVVKSVLYLALFIGVIYHFRIDAKFVSYVDSALKTVLRR